MTQFWLVFDYNPLRWNQVQRAFSHDCSSLDLVMPLKRESKCKVLLTYDTLDIRANDVREVCRRNGITITQVRNG
jgi:hypothetical protein